MEEIKKAVEDLQDLLISHATGTTGDDDYYRELRERVLSEPGLQRRLPIVVRRCRNLGQFWAFIQPKFKTYRERREYLWGEFEPLVNALEQDAAHPTADSVADILVDLDAAHISEAWAKALDRRQSDPEGAITMARSLLESVCKNILEELTIEYDDVADLPKLYRQVSEALNLAPSQHTEREFKQILGSCTTVVERLGTLRNRLGDSHGKGGRSPVRPAIRHAELAVNLAGAMAQFLVATWKARPALLDHGKGCLSGVPGEQNGKRMPHRHPFLAELPNWFLPPMRSVW